MQEKEELEMDHCEETEVHEELLRIVQEKLPEAILATYDTKEAEKDPESFQKKKSFMIWRSFIRYLEILPVSGFCLFCLKRRSVSATLRQPCR